MADLPAELILAVAQALMMAGRWDLADRLLAGAAASGRAGQAERALLALGRAQAAVEIRQWRGTGDPAAALGEADVQVSRAGTPAAAFDLELLRLFADYWAELLPTDGRAPGFGPDGRDPAVLAGLTQRAGRLAATAPDQRRAARAAFYGGLVADNLCGEHSHGEALFTRALNACEPGAGDDIASEALRHLGGIAQEAGDLPLARERWERSAELAQRAGWLPLALAQQALLAELASERGEHAAAAALAGEVHRWARALGLRRLESQAAAVPGAGQAGEPAQAGHQGAGGPPA